MTPYKNNVTQILLTFDGPGLDKNNVDAIIKRFYECCDISNRKNKSAEIHQYDRLQAILYLFGNEGANTIGEAFLANRLNDLRGHKVLRIERKQLQTTI